MTDSHGHLRLIVPFLANWAGDLEELLELLGLSSNTCLHCMAMYHELDGVHICEPRTGASILAALASLRETYFNATPYQFMTLVRKEGLIGVEDLWFDGVVDDPCRIMGVDLLHGVRKFFYDHVVLWVCNLIGEEQLDRHFMIQLHLVGSEVRNFPSGISQLKQVQGKEIRAIISQLLCVMASAEGVQDAHLIAVHAFLDFSMMCSFPVITEQTLTQMDNCLEIWHKKKISFIESGARHSKKGQPMQHFKIPKAHRHNHITQQIETLGTLRGFDQEAFETIHINMVKNPYRCSNRRDFELQILKAIQRNESLDRFQRFAHSASESEDSDSESESESDSDSDSDPEPFRDSDTGDAGRVDKCNIDSEVTMIRNRDNGIQSQPDSHNTVIDKSLLGSLRLSIAQQAHKKLKTTELAGCYYGFQNFVSAMIRFFEHGISGFENGHSRRYFADSELLPNLQRIELWESCKILIPPPNVFHPASSRTLHCRLMEETMSSHSDLANDFVWCNVYPDKTGYFQSMFCLRCSIVLERYPLMIHVYSGYRAAQLCAIFRLRHSKRKEDSASPRQILVYVRWFNEASSPNRHHKMRVVKKMTNFQGEWLGGIVPLACIEHLISLYPVIGPTVDLSELNEGNCIDRFDSFYINPFHSHDMYATFA